MSETPSLHRGHVALLGQIHDGEPRKAYERGGTVQIDGVPQDFLVGWYTDLKTLGLLAAEDLLGRSGDKLGETIRITDEGLALYQRNQPAA